MDISNEFQEISIFFADNGFVTVLEEVATPFMTFVEGDGIAGHEAAHDFAEWGMASSQQQVKVVGNKSPSITLGLGLFEDDAQTIEE